MTQAIRVEWLKVIRDMPPGSDFTEGTNSMQELIWIQDLERDRYITAKFRMGYSLGDGVTDNSDVPNAIYDVHILEKGRQLILEFDAPPKKPQTDWVRVGVWIALAALAATIFIYLAIYFLAR